MREPTEKQTYPFSVPRHDWSQQLLSSRKNSSSGSNIFQYDVNYEAVGKYEGETPAVYQNGKTQPN
jgi:hypothetical protein